MDLVFKRGSYLKEILTMNSFSFEDKVTRTQAFTRLKPGLALRLLIKGLFYIRAMKYTYFKGLENDMKRLRLQNYNPV